MSRFAVIITFLAGVLALVSLDVRPAAAAIVYMGPYEANRTLSQAFAAMQSGDTLIIRDGIYRGADNVILSTWGGGGPHVPPSGSAPAYTVIRAEHEGQVTFDGEGVRTVFDISDGDFQYIEFHGLKWVNSISTAVTLNGGTVSHIKFFRCGAKIQNQADNSSSWSISHGEYLLLEECYAWGSGRYGIKVQNIHAGGARKVVVRRCVVRLDDANGISSGEGGRMPIGGFISYCAPEVEFQNCIVIDSDSSYWKNFSYTQGAFGTRPYAWGTSDWATDVSFRGVIALNVLGWTHSYYEPETYQAGFSLTNEANDHPNLVEQSIAWDVMKAVGFSADANISTTVTPQMRNLTLKTADNPAWPADPNAGASGMSWTHAPVWSLRNSALINNQNVGLIGIKSDYNSVYTTGIDWQTWYGGPGARDYTDSNGNEINPLTGVPGNGVPAFKYILRQEPGSDLNGTGENGANRGATVTKRYGVSGSLWGEPGYNTLTDEDLWPFPYETQIRADMQTYSPQGGPAGTRGFCANGQTLTNYIWGYLGNAVPPLGLVATPGSGSVTLSWARPADVALPSIVGFNVYRVDGGQRTLVGTVNGNATYTATITGLDSSGSYAFALTTADAVKGESGLSGLAILGTPSGLPGSGSPPSPAPVTRTTPAISWPTPAPISQGTALSGTQLNATASVPGTFVYAPAAGTVLPAGTQVLSASFTPTDAVRYNTAQTQTSLVVNTASVSKTTPAITWPTPAPISQGTALSGAQLNATAAVAGSFAYSPAAGIVLAAGTYTLTATFTPADTSLYNSNTARTNITVNPTIYQLSVVRPTGGMVNGAGINCGTTGTGCQVTMTASMSLGLQATPDAGYSFSGWTGDCTGTNPSFTLQLNGSRSCGATFTAVSSTPPPTPTTAPPPADSGLPLGAPYTLSIARPAGGTVRGAGLNCGTKGKSCVVTMPGPMSLGLQATPDSGYVFTNWTLHCSGTNSVYSLRLDGTRACGATFAPAGNVPPPAPGITPAPAPAPTDGSLPMGAPYVLTVTRPTGGMIRSAGTSCGSKGGDCSVTMPAAMWLGLQATPDAGYSFAGWTGNCSGTSLSYALALNGPRTCGGTFTKTTTGSRP